MRPIPNGTFIGDDSRTGVYVLTSEKTLTLEMIELLRAEWARTFGLPGGEVPALLCLGPGLDLHHTGEPGNDGLVPGAEFCCA